MEGGIYFIEQTWHRRSSQVGVSGKRCCGAFLDRETAPHPVCILAALESPKTPRLPVVAVVPGSASKDVWKDEARLV